MRNYNDFDENFRFLVHSIHDKEIKKAFNLEVLRAIKQFINWYKNGNTLREAEDKMRRSYGIIISDMALIHLEKAL